MIVKIFFIIVRVLMMVVVINYEKQKEKMMVKIYSPDGMVLMIVGDGVCKAHDGNGWQQPWWWC